MTALLQVGGDDDDYYYTTSCPTLDDYYCYSSGSDKSAV
jgi:hypothetical protein